MVLRLLQKNFARLAQGLLVLGAVLALLPFWLMFTSSLADPAPLLAGEPLPLWVWPWRLDNYQQLFTRLPMAQYVANSLIVTTLTTAGHVLLCAMAGYAFARLPVKGRNGWFWLVLLTLMVPPQVNLVPLFFLMRELGWIDTHWALIVPGLFGGFGIFLFRQWFTALPAELEEAARLDGCSVWQTFWKIAFPTALPAVATLALFVAIATWNSFLWPLVVLHSDGVKTLPLGLATLKESFRDTMNWPLLMAAATVATVPVVGVFLLGQRYFIQGLLAGSVKE